jgi:phosphoribosyl 1,2-cyclic phosphate phosphodiesterase
MKFRYLGTAAAEGVPALFCCCDVCKRSKDAGGRNIRTRSQALVDGELLIDFPPDTYLHCLHGGLDLMKVRHCLLTHTHADHLMVADITMRRAGFAHFEHDAPFDLTFHASSKACATLAGQLGEDMMRQCHVRVQAVEPFVPFAVERFSVTAFKADHDPNSGPLFFSVGDGRKTLLYANDTGCFPDETWAYLQREKPHFDFVSLDCTGALVDYRRGHMGAAAGAETQQRLLEIGCADAKTVWCYHHFSHNGRATHDEFVPLAREKGFLVSHDGMDVEL